MTKKLESWGRQSKETPPAFEAFVTYRDQGAQRSHANVARKLRKSTQLVSRWSRVHGWVDRVKAWDEELDRRARAATSAEVAEMAKRHVRLADQMLELSGHELRKRLKQAEKDKDKPAATVYELVRLLKEGTTIERLARGEPGEVVEVAGRTVDLSVLSVQELKLLKQINAKLRGGGDVDDGEEGEPEE